MKILLIANTSKCAEDMLQKIHSRATEEVEVIIARSQEEADELMKKERFDSIISDINCSQND